MEISQTIMNNPIFNITTLVLAVFGIFFTVYFYFRSKKSRIPTYAVRTINLVSSNISKINILDILYSGEKINNLSISKVALWNDGKETINSTDIAPLKPIKIMINDKYDILDATILFQKNDGNNFILNLATDKKSVDITFDYFDYKDGIVLQIFHTGNSNEYVRIEGGIKSVSKICRRKLPLLAIIPSSKMAFILIIMGILGMIVPVCIYIYWYLNYKEFYGFELNSITSLIVGLGAFVVGYQSIKRIIPKGYDMFSDNSFLINK